MIRTVVWMMVWLAATTASAAEFSSKFDAQDDRVWIGADYWANPMEDWSLVDGKLQRCGARDWTSA